MMKINKIINNNVVSVLHNNQESVVMGKGIGFQKQDGDLVEESKIDKIFTLNDQEISDRFKKLLIEVPIEIVEIAEQIISIAKNDYQKTLNDTVYVAFTDHINFAIERQRNNQPIKNGLIWEIKKFYPTEYEIGLKALSIIETQLNISLPIDEAGFIAIHIINAENNQLSSFDEVTETVRNILSLVKYHFRISFDEESLTFYRFVTHLKFFAQRIHTTSSLYNEDHSLYEIVKEKYPSIYKCVIKIETYLLKKYDYHITKEEKLYLMIHIQRLINKNESVDKN